MNNKKRLRLLRLQHELDLLTAEMALAMQNANTEYVASGRNTPNMDVVLRKFYDWARRYEEAGK